MENLDEANSVAAFYFGIFVLYIVCDILEDVQAWWYKRQGKGSYGGGGSSEAPRSPLPDSGADMPKALKDLMKTRKKQKVTVI